MTTEAGMAGSPMRAALLPLERALLQHHGGWPRQRVRVLVDDGTEHAVPAALFFRSGRSRLAVDRAALRLCRGRVLDVGAGAGALALPLQEAGHEVTALELLPGAARILRDRGVRDVRQGNLWTFRWERPYDTVLALMNGTAPAGTLAGLPGLLDALACPLAPGGQLLVDSTDLRGRGERGRARRPDGRYVGELQYQLEHDGERGPPFPQLFVDPEQLAVAAAASGLAAAMVWSGRGGSYLVRMTRV